jgi:uncharacterized lipoprotein YddW (UPF0748 family)/N-acetylmuramoyl-L-alanine amidase
MMMLILLLTAPVALPAPTASGEEAEAPEFRGLWVASVYNLDYPSAAGMDADALKAEAVTLLDKASNIGFNAVFLQVRPMSDALYPSDIFPWSAFVSGQQGVAPAGDFDPLAFWIEEAHKRDIELHAWINPFRVAAGSPDQPAHDLNRLASNHPARQHPEWTVPYKNGNLYYDPGIPGVQEMIIAGVREIVRRYPVDGIHYDDYFYPDTDFPDQASYAAYGNSVDLGDWRRANINTFIQNTRSAIQDTYKAKLQEAGLTEAAPSPEAVPPEALPLEALPLDADAQPNLRQPRFGVSPFGIWLNTASSPEGSDTNGSESYRRHYADTRSWVKNQWLDYICPQIYWHIGYEIADYSRLVRWWADTVNNTTVDLYIGMAAYRAGSETHSQDPWYGTGEITRQLTLNAQYPQIKGHIMYRYQSFVSNPMLGSAVKEIYREPAGRWFQPAEPSIPTPAFSSASAEPGRLLSVGRPAQDITTGQSQYFMLGVSDPGQPLFINGQEVSGRTSQGYFSVYTSLKSGDNPFTLTQEGQTPVTRRITRAASGGGSSASSTPEIQDIPFERGLYAQVVLPQTASRNNPTFAAYVYERPSTSGGPQGELTGGQTDRVAAQTADGQWLRLGIGLWIPASSVRLYESAEPLINTLSNSSYAQTQKWDAVTWTVSQNSATAVTYNESALIFEIQAADSCPGVDLPAGVPFASVQTSYDQGLSPDQNKARYTFVLRPGQRIEGYYVSTAPGQLTLHIKKPVYIPVSQTELPLANHVILLDPGHGGSDPGALGPLGEALPEKTINLYIALKIKTALEQLGAAVHMTRTEDVYVSLEDRVEMNRALLPDLFLSIHANSMDESVDASRIAGVSTWYKEAVSEDFARFMYQYLWNRLGREQKESHQSNLYVCRPAWTPSFIVETGFVCNPSEFAWLTDNLGQDELAQGIARAVTAYYML